MIAPHHLAFAFGLLGNIVGFMVFLAPVPTFYRICKKKSAEGFQSFPYSVALFSATLTLYYGLLKPNGMMLITINSIGCAIESLYLIIYFMFATKADKIFTTRLMLFFNAGVFGSIVIFTSFIHKASTRTTVVGWMCAVFSVCVCAAPLSIMRRVIKTKSVEYMPFLLSFFLTLCATMWFFYGLLIHDYFIALPNTLGFIFGILQMTLYLIYKNSHTQGDNNPQELTTVDKPNKLVTSMKNQTPDIEAQLEVKETNKDTKDSAISQRVQTFDLEDKNNSNV